MLMLMPSLTIIAKGETDQQNVINQMNYCISSLTNIIHNKSIAVLDHESDQIVNNLTMEQSVGLTEIKDFRIDLLDAISKFEITEEERQLMRRIGSIRRDNAKWAALSNALSPTMLITGSKLGAGTYVQIGFQILTAAARTAVEYRQASGESDIEELQAMWNLRKEDLQTINELRKNALDITFNLYNKYKLTESDRLTEATANQFCDYINEKDIKRRIRLLENNRATYSHYPDYYYYLGMAYLDEGNIIKADANFKVYGNLYDKAPLLRYDEKTGCIALACMTYKKELSQADKISLIDVALKNLPHNSAAILQCAMTYIYELHEPSTGLKLLLMGIDDPDASDVDILYLAAAKMFPLIPRTLFNSFDNYFNNSAMSLGTYMLWNFGSPKNVWGKINGNIQFKDYTYRRWYQLWIGKYFDSNFKIVLPGRLQIAANGATIFYENHDDDNVDIIELSIRDTKEISDEDIENVDCFKSNKDLKYLYVNKAPDGKGYFLKSDIDLDKIKQEEWPRQSEFVLSEDDIDDIVDFCKDHKTKTDENTYECEEMDTDFVTLDSLNDARIRFKGHKLTYTPHHSRSQMGKFIRIVFDNGINLLFKYDKDDNTIKPFLCSYDSLINYANKDCQKEYESNKIVNNDIDPWYSRMWKWISRQWHSFTNWIINLF